MKEGNPSRVNRLTALFSMVTPRKHLNSSLFVLHSSLHLIQRLRVFLRNILFYHQIFDDEVLALHRILTHIIFQQLLHLIGFMQRNLLQSHVGTDEMGEFISPRLSDFPLIVPKLMPNTIWITVRITESMMKMARLASIKRPMRLNMAFYSFP